MKNLLSGIAGAALCVLSVGCHNTSMDAGGAFVTVRDGDFYIGDSVYRVAGTNMWYGAVLGSTGRGGDRARLGRELDRLRGLGVNNLRVLVGAEGRENVPSHIMPVLQTAPGVYNDTVLDGLDYLMAELEKRGMTAVLYLNNAWEWSGGYGEYLHWAGEATPPDPTLDGYRQYVDYVARFVHSDSAKAMAARHVKYIVGRTNRYTGEPYSSSKALMSWQIANEPRAFAADSATKAAFAEWIAGQAALIRSLDPNHLVSTGSEGAVGCEGDIDLWTAIHSNPDIDYGIIHIWPANWGWVRRDSLVADVGRACAMAHDYVADHAARMKAVGKPLVIEEFGYPRDGMSYAPGSPTEGRDCFYSYIFSLVSDSALAQGCNFWAWGGEAVPPHDTWRLGDPYTGDPAQEPQGLYSVFDADSSTVGIIRAFAARLGAE